MSSFRCLKQVSFLLRSSFLVQRNSSRIFINHSNYSARPFSSSRVTLQYQDNIQRLMELARTNQEFQNAMIEIQKAFEKVKTNPDGSLSKTELFSVLIQPSVRESGKIIKRICDENDIVLKPEDIMNAKNSILNILKK
ncbi:uncharacterized protein ASCRUDRAFT_71390 [Ascoidea rubescens DSM 1968]|uniref:EF-hand domain-containing protein n=1 Tax=Ascoidea rubescens DSM 1968 TaxID=1344418 RepID=A0A1D2VDY6_9ASCO|nr:hypothetical protein ASCRUDRAFT_71390 [Ascoidea rubescens DSM 1968]ODV59904.1 hypothetical protein ASCRUDRAFT_71390 [Ascoidea rubescens DSM 1968]